MSLRSFQRVLSEMVASPEFCREALVCPGKLSKNYDLTPLEYKRVVHCLRHRGMKVCWSLHRANRLGPIDAVLPLTCTALGSDLRGELELFWEQALPKDLQFRSE